MHLVNGEFVQNAFFDGRDLGFLRGYGVFDYAPIYNGRPFHLKDHIDRLKWSAAQVDLVLPEDLYDKSLELTKKNEPQNAGLRFVLSAGQTLLDDPNWMILFEPFKGYPMRFYAEGMRLLTTTTLRTFPEVKTLCYLPGILAVKRALKAGFDDALYISSKGEVLEGVTSNIFFIKGNTLITSDSDAIVKGVTRGVVLDLAKEMEIEFRSLPLVEIGQMDEAFLTSSTKDLVPVCQIGSQIIGKGVPGEKTTRLRAFFHRHLEKYFDLAVI